MIGRGGGVVGGGCCGTCNVLYDEGQVRGDTSEMQCGDELHWDCADHRHIHTNGITQLDKVVYCSSTTSLFGSRVRCGPRLVDQSSRTMLSFAASCLIEHSSHTDCCSTVFPPHPHILTPYMQLCNNDAIVLR